MLLDFSLGNDFLDMISKVQARKAIIHKWDYLKLKNKNGNNQHNERQSKEWEKKIFEPYIQ